MEANRKLRNNRRTNEDFILIVNRSMGDVGRIIGQWVMLVE